MEWRLNGNDRVLDGGEDEMLQTSWTIQGFEPESQAGLYQVLGQNPAGISILEEWLVQEAGKKGEGEGRREGEGREGRREEYPFPPIDCHFLSTFSQL